jgi:subtilisin-like proprotein convertase family protein
MESLFKPFKLCLAVLIIFAVGNTNAQNSQAGYYGGQWLSSSPSDNTVSSPGVSYENRIAPPYQQYNNSVITPPSGQTDEYGYFNFNAYCSGFTGTEWIAVPNPSSYWNENFDGAVEMWINPTSFSGSGTTLMSLGATSNKAFGWYVTGAGQFSFRIGNTELIHTGTAIPLNTWTHVGVSWTGGGPFTVTFFVNGVQSGSTMNNTGTWNVVSDSLRIGRDESFTGSAFHGSIDEVRFWANARSVSEFALNRFVGLGDGNNANASGALTSSSHYVGLKASWNFNTSNNPTLELIAGHNGYLRGALTQTYAPYAPNPIPYNFALNLSGGANDYLVIPDNAAFDQTSSGSIEAWVYMTTASHLNTIFHKGTSFTTGSLAFYVTASNKMGINIGPHNYISTGQTLAANKWYHLAATWTGGPNFTVKEYVNGVLDYTSTFNGAMPTNSDPAWIGRYYTTTGNFTGYIDEVRFWGVERTQDQIRQCMFASGRILLPNANLLGLWNFDGNLLNRSAVTGIDASFNSGGTNNGYISAFRNENTGGVLSNSYVAHATVVNRVLSSSPFPFPSGFIVRVPQNKPINDNQSTFDTINVSSSLALSSINVFMAIRHTYCGDLSITLKAPNGQTRDLSSGNGGTGEDILTFFVDGSQAVTTSTFYPPWSNVAGPEATMGTFGGTNIQGNWILEVHDGAGGDTGEIIGWGLRFNDAVTNIEPVSNTTPGTYALHQNYPNPFNPVTNIRFDIPKASEVKLVIYDILGREIRYLLNEFRNPGSYNISFDASNLASGTYFYKIEAGDFTSIKKMVLVK